MLLREVGVSILGLINKSVGLNEAGGAGAAGLQALRSAATGTAGAFSTLPAKNVLLLSAEHRKSSVLINFYHHQPGNWGD